MTQLFMSMCAYLRQLEFTALKLVTFWNILAHALISELPQIAHQDHIFAPDHQFFICEQKLGSLTQFVIFDEWLEPAFKFLKLEAQVEELAKLNIPHCESLKLTSGLEVVCLFLSY